MALEKECDFVLRLLNNSKASYTINALHNHLKDANYRLTPNELVTLVTILVSNDHVYPIYTDRDQTIGITLNNDTGELEYRGGLRISQKGCGFIVNSSYEDEKSRNELLLEITLSNAKIQWRLLHINRWIAFGGIAVAVSSILEIVRNYYNPLLPFLINYALPFLTFLFAIWLSYIALQAYRNKQNKNT